MTWGDKPFGLRQVVVTNIGGTTQVPLPVGRKLLLKERIRKGELSGDDKLVGVVAFSDAADWDLESGGINLEAWALLTGRTATIAGSAPTRTDTYSGKARDTFPYMKLYGKSIGDGSDDVHCKLWKCKVLEFEGELMDNAFFVTKCKGIAVDDGVNGIFTLVQNETAAALPAS